MSAASPFFWVQHLFLQSGDGVPGFAMQASRGSHLRFKGQQLNQPGAVDLRGRRRFEPARPQATQLWVRQVSNLGWGECVHLCLRRTWRILRSYGNSPDGTGSVQHCSHWSAASSRNLLRRFWREEGLTSADPSIVSAYLKIGFGNFLKAALWFYC